MSTAITITFLWTKAAVDHFCKAIRKHHNRADSRYFLSVVRAKIPVKPTRESYSNRTVGTYDIVLLKQHTPVFCVSTEV